MYDHQEENVDEMIIALWNAGHTALDIAGRLGKTRSAIAGKLYRLRAQKRVQYKSIKNIAYNDNAPLTTAERRLLERIKASVEPRPQAVKLPPAGRMFRPAPQPAESGETPHVYFDRSASKGIMELGPFDCRYIVNEWVRGRPALYCGSPQTKGPYCSAHAEICYREQIALTKKERRLLAKAFAR